jgi:uncharacterized membrane protein YqgA involved in biofilm formation
MLGTLFNVGGILLGGTVGLLRRKPLPPATEAYAQIILAALTVFFGLRLTWLSLNGTVLQILKQLLIAVLALALGRFTGGLLRLQKFSNHLGRQARDSIAAIKPGALAPPGAGFKTCAALFCAAPLAVLGAVQDGLHGYFSPLAIKAMIDGLAALGFVQIFGGSVLLSALPVLAFQGTLTLLCEQAAPGLLARHWLDSINAVGGLLVFSVGLVMFGVKRFRLADYVPSLFFAPLLTWLWP